MAEQPEQPPVTRSSRFGFVYNQHKDAPDPRDIPLNIPRLIKSVILPAKYDLRDGGFVPDILDQGNLGSCGPSQMSNALRHCLRKQKSEGQKIHDFQPSRLYIYYNTRLVDRSPISEDTGVTMRGMFKAVSRDGACDEKGCQYIIKNYAKRPTPANYVAGRSHTPGYVYYKVNQNLTEIKQAILMGYPILIGILVYESLERDETLETGTIPMPNTQKEHLLGGHAVGLYGWNDETQRFYMMNTWGKNVGDKGWFTIPYAYVLDRNLAWDFWTARYFK